MVKLTDKFIFGNVFKQDQIELEIEKPTLKDVIDSLIEQTDKNALSYFDFETMFDSYLFILNGTKVLDKTEYDMAKFKDGDTLTIAPLISGG